ncbi:hypothetical protein HQ81_0168 [Dickeya phage phiDP23.1]|uniref:Uncharacterized protein n=1 Tax=Dickeya phage phiDP23.1 TaxID=1542133 RepID=A0A140XBL8_9CAUD|nr:hypothetical protein HQ81_0168 [Dickeya phage phiDP23.1]
MAGTGTGLAATRAGTRCGVVAVALIRVLTAHLIPLLCSDVPVQDLNVSRTAEGERSISPRLNQTGQHHYNRGRYQSLFRLMSLAVVDHKQDGQYQRHTKQEVDHLDSPTSCALVIPRS